MSDKIKTGNRGEEIAADFLLDKGYEILVTNYRYKHSEIDLIVKKKDLLVFVEVKTRSSTSFGEPENFVDDKKAKKIFEGAEHYIFEINWQEAIRFDIISVVMHSPIEVTHFEDAFY